MEIFTGDLQLKEDSNAERWIAARFDNQLPKSFTIGGNQMVGGYQNRALEDDLEYVAFLAASEDGEVRKKYKMPKLSCHHIYGML